jgi:nucleoside-diphosphate-sugar epimerase
LNILVTTDTRSLGGNIIKKLTRETDHQIILLNTDLTGTGTVDYSGYDIVQHQCDIADLLGLIELSKDVDLIIHAAECRSPLKKNKQSFFDINHQGTAHIVDCCLANGVRQLMYISHVSALGGDRGRPLTEDDIWMDKPLKSIYGHSKYLGEQEVWRGQAEGLKVNIIAHSTVVSKDLRVKSNSSEHTETIVSEQDVVDMVRVLVDRGLDGEKYICSAHRIAHDELRETLLPRADDKGKMNILSGWREKIADMLGLNSAYQSPNLIKPKPNMDYDNQKSIDNLGFTYRSIEETIDVR